MGETLDMGETHSFIPELEDDTMIQLRRRWVSQAAEGLHRSCVRIISANRHRQLSTFSTISETKFSSNTEPKQETTFEILEKKLADYKRKAFGEGNQSLKKNIPGYLEVSPVFLRSPERDWLLAV